MAKTRPDLPTPVPAPSVAPAPVGPAVAPAAPVSVDQATTVEPLLEPGPTNEPAEAGPTVYCVELQNSLFGTRFVVAQSPDEAWQKYTEAGGIISSQYLPKISLASPDKIDLAKLVQ